MRVMQAEDNQLFADNIDAEAMPADLRRIVLTGFMGAGKSTVGRVLARRLGWKFIDLDEHIESRAGLSVPEIFDLHGQDHFRRLESTALASVLSRENAVLALGGGTPEVLTNRLLLEQTPGTVIVFLDAPFPALFDRCMLQSISRPVLADPVAAQLRFVQRQPLYHRLAQHTIDTSAIDSEEAARAVFDALVDSVKSIGKPRERTVAHRTYHSNSLPK